MKTFFNELDDTANGAVKLLAVSNENPLDKKVLSFNDVKNCCHDDSAGGGCLYLDEEKLKLLVIELTG